MLWSPRTKPSTLRTTMSTGEICTWKIAIRSCDTLPTLAGLISLATTDQEGRRDRMDQGSRATSLIVSSLVYFRTLRDEKLTPIIFHQKPDYTKNKAWKLSSNCYQEN